MEAPIGVAHRPVESRPFRQVRLHADDWLDPGVLRLLDEIDNPVEDPVIGDGYRRLTIGFRGRNHILDPGRTVEHRVLGVDVEVCE